MMETGQAEKYLESINPANLQVLGKIKYSSQDEIINKVEAAHRAKKAWKELGIKKRIAILRPLIDAFKARVDDIILLTTREMGKPLVESKGDIKFDFDYFEAFLNDAPQYLEDEITLAEGKKINRIVYEPRGVVASIVPWNFPFSNFIWGVIPNLIVGNTVIFKFSEECPLLGKLMEEVMLSIPELRQGVFAEIYGDGETGAFLAEQNVDMIWFTGSSTVGKKLYEVAGKKQIKAILEMGGSNPAVVFEDVDIDTIVPAIYRARFSNCGQICDALKRLIVHESIYQQVVDKLVKHIEAIKVGDPENEQTEMGPLVAMRQLHVVEEQMADAVKRGAKVLIGGKHPDHLTGAFYLPTLVVDVKPEMRIWKEEVFAPVLPVVSFATEEEAIQLANDTVYGLGAFVYSNNLERARRVAAQIDAGAIDINEGNHWTPSNPFGGHKNSGMGCEHGRLGFQELCKFKVIAEG